MTAILLILLLLCLLPPLLESKARGGLELAASTLGGAPPTTSGATPTSPTSPMSLFTKLTTDVEVAVVGAGGGGVGDRNHSRPPGRRLVLRRRVASFGTGHQYQALELQVDSRSRANLTLSVEKMDGAALDEAWENHREQGRVQKFQGIFGIYQLPSGYFVALIKSSANATAFPAESGVREIREISLIKIPAIAPASSSHSPPALSPLQMERQRDALSMLLEAVSRHTFYFTHIIASHGFDVTRSTQSRMDIVEHLSLDTRSQLQWRCCDERFFWNFNLVTPLIDAGLDDWVVPVTNAWASCKDIFVGGKAFQLSLISRRSRHRQGQRYIKRGADKSGDVANFVETEQVLSSPDFVSSFVQVRGSIPLFWSQPETWRLRPSILHDSLNLAMHATAAKTHLIDLLCSYALSSITQNHSVSSSSSPSSSPSVFLVNLIDKTGSQGKLGRLLYAALHRIETPAAQDSPFEEDSEKGEDDEGGAEVLAASSRDATLSDGTLLSTADFSCRYSNEDLSKEISRGKGYFAGSKLAEMYAQFGGASRGGKKFSQEDKEVEGDNGQEDDEAPGEVLDDDRSSVPGVVQTRLIWFDYHAKCKKGNVTAIREIFEPLSDALKGDNAYYFSSLAPSSPSATTTLPPPPPPHRHHHSHHNTAPPRRLQRCIIRTNCIDCLDRTNVVQTAIARWVLLQQVADAGALNGRLLGDAALAMQLPHEASEAALRALWGDNGDMMSMLYAGTKALKRDVTRLGKRTQQGAIDDGINSAMRYYINNYQDERNQRGLDIALGYANSEGKSLPQRIFSKITQSAAHVHKWAKRTRNGSLARMDAAEVDDDDDGGGGEEEEEEEGDETIVEAIDEALSALADLSLNPAAAAARGTEAVPPELGERVNTTPGSGHGMNEVLEETLSVVDEPIKVVLDDLRTVLASQQMKMKKRQHKKKRVKGLKRRDEEGLLQMQEETLTRHPAQGALQSIASNLVFVLLPLAFYWWGRWLRQFQD